MSLFVVAAEPSPSTGLGADRFHGASAVADATAPAVRLSMWNRSRLSAPLEGVPMSVREQTRRRTISFNGCTANIVHDDHGSVLGVVGAAHCVRPVKNSMFDGGTFGSGTRWPIARSSIMLDEKTDVFYTGLAGHDADDVLHQIRKNYERADIENLATTTTFVMTGYPLHQNPRGEPVSLSLALGGMVRWPGDPNDTIATFSDWNEHHQSCSPRSSGSGLYHHVDGHGWVVIGVLSSHAEFVEVRTMPYDEEYGLELRSFFERQLDTQIDAHYMCGFAPPSPPQS